MSNEPTIHHIQPGGALATMAKVHLDKLTSDLGPVSPNVRELMTHVFMAGAGYLMGGMIEANRGKEKDYHQITEMFCCELQTYFDDLPDCLAPVRVEMRIKELPTDRN